jgi:hypothetical protein
MVRVTAAELLDKYSEKHNDRYRQEAAEELKMRKLFAARSAHLPGNNWCQDWTQWMMNNHPLLGLCCRHRLNPVGMCPRLVILISSISFGLIATNLVFLFYRTHPDANGELITLTMEESKRFVVTYEAVVLWTVGGLLHSLADLGMWHLTACACCVGSCFAKAGPYFAVCISAILCALSTFAIFWRVEYEIRQGADDGESEIDWVQWRTVESLQFLVSYFVELATGKCTMNYQIALSGSYTFCSTAELTLLLMISLFFPLSHDGNNLLFGCCVGMFAMHWRPSKRNQTTTRRSKEKFRSPKSRLGLVFWVKVCDDNTNAHIGIFTF